MTNPSRPGRKRPPYLKVVPNAIHEQPDKCRDSIVLLPDSDKERNHNNIMALKAVGCTFQCDADDKNNAIQTVLLPIGWKKVATNNSGYKYLVDTQNRKRIEMYSFRTDRAGFKTIVRRIPRFRLMFDRIDNGKNAVGVTKVLDCAEEIYTTRPAATELERKLATARATRWLDLHYPHWKDPGSYWD